VVIGFFQASQASPAWARLMAWQNLAADSPATGKEQLMAWMVADIRRRQDAGELAGDLDPSWIALILFAAASAPAMLPSIARTITGLDPADPQFQQAYSAQLGAMIGHLRAGSERGAD
jgi:TetR/AcrR family transcriptional regulator